MSSEARWGKGYITEYRLTTLNYKDSSPKRVKLLIADAILEGLYTFELLFQLKFMTVSNREVCVF